MSMKKHLGMAILFSGLMGGFGNPKRRFEEEEFEPKEVKKIIPKGCKEYTHKNITVIAISEKSAIKKINKKLNDK